MVEALPAHVVKRITTHPSHDRHGPDELFRFGNGGTQRSNVRYRLPMMVGNNLVAVWVSVVKVPSLGLLLGRDFLDGIGAVVSFTKQKLRPA